MSTPVRKLSTHRLAALRPWRGLVIVALSILTLHPLELSAQDPGWALRFDGVSDWAHLGFVEEVFGDDWAGTKTLSLWLNPTGAAACTAPHPLACDVIVGDLPRTWGITRGTVNGQDRLWVVNWDGSPDYVGIPYTPGEWIHIAVVHDAGRLIAYKNGLEVGNIPSGPTVTPPVQTTLHLGGIINNGSRVWTFQGDIDEVRFWSTTRSAGEILEDMSRVLDGDEPGLVAYYRMTDGGGPTVSDDSTNGRTMTLDDGGDGVPADGPVEWVASGAFGSSPNQPPTADDISLETAEDTGVGVTLTGTDPEGASLTYQVVAPPDFGTLSGEAPELSYTPDADYSGEDGFTFTVNDGVLDSNTATVTVTVTPVNDPPVAVPDAASTTVDVSVEVAVLANDTDVDGDLLTIGSLGPATHGVVEHNGTTVTYTPAAGYVGPDSFTYMAQDGRGGVSEADVVVTVADQNRTPTANSQSVTTPEDDSVGIVLTGSDPDGDPLTYQVVTGPGNGALAGLPPNLTYTPDPDFNGPDAFTFETSDGELVSAPATVTVEVTPVNDWPVALADAAVTDPGTPVRIPVLSNDSDVDGDPLTVVATGNASNGLVENNVDSVTYTPDADYVGTDTFTYTVSDPFGRTASAEVEVTVRMAADPVEVGSVLTSGYANDVVVAGAYAYVAATAAGLQVIDVSDPSSPTPAGSLSTTGHALGVAVSGDYAYVANGRDGLRVIDVRDPTMPVEVSFHDTPGYAQDVEVDGTLAYVADRWGGLSIIDVADPAVPFEVGWYPTTDWVLDVAVTGDYVLLAEYGAGVRILDIGNPAQPFQVGFYEPPHRTYGVMVVGNTAYVANGDKGLRILDVSDPQFPTEVGFYDTDGFSRSVFTSGGYAFVADWNDGLAIVDVTSPSDPVLTGHVATPGRTRDVTVSGPYIFIADYEGGLRIFAY